MEFKKLAVAKSQMTRFKDLLANKDLAKNLLAEANSHFQHNPNKKNLDRLKSLLHGYNSQLEALSERLGLLPKSVSPTHIFNQMEKIENQRQRVQEQLDDLQRQGLRSDKPSELKDYLALLQHLKAIANDTNLDSRIQSQLVRRLIKCVEVGVDFVRIHFIVGESSVRMGRHALVLLEKTINEGADSSAPSQFDLNVFSAKKNAKVRCSNSLTFGSGERT